MSSKQRGPELEIRKPFVHYGRVGFESDEPSMTKQSFKDECDINVIMRRYEASGILPVPQSGEPRYADLVGSADFQEAMFAVAEARAMFAELPSRVRERFDNDPQRLLEFLEDPKNVEEGRELGLLRAAEPEATPVSVRVVDAPTARSGETSDVSEGGGTPAVKPKK